MDERLQVFRHQKLQAFGICVLLAVLHTWPLAVHPGRYSHNDNADTQLNEWILAWIAHQAPRDPLHLFEANIFYPAHDALAFSEPLIVPGLIGAPVAWLGGSPVLVYNLVLMAGFALSAFAAFLLVERWTGSFGAGLIAGSAFAFNTHTLTRLAHVQAIHTYALPIVLLAADRLVRGPSRKAALTLAAGLVLLAYTSGYLIVFACVMLMVIAVARAAEWTRRVADLAPSWLLAAGVAAAGLMPMAIPYARVAREQHMVRSLDVVREYEATPTGYIAAAGRLHFATWSARFFKNPVDSFFPGFTVVALAMVAIAGAFRRGTDADVRRRVVMLLAVAVTGFVLSLGTATPIYGWLFRVFPPMQGLRAAARFGNLFLFALAVLAGLGAARLRSRWLVVAAIILVNLEALRAPFPYVPFTGISPVYSLLKREPGPVVLVEQPFFPRWAIFENGPYVLNSTAHWRPLMNGYSGYTPEGYQTYADAFWYFPQDWAIQAMKDAGVTHVVVHAAAYQKDHQAVLPVLDARPDFELLAIGSGDVRLYRLKR